MKGADDGINWRRVARAARCFGPRGRLTRWPSRRADQLLVLLVVWSYLPDARRMDEAQVTSMLRDWHDFGDHVLLRRELVDLDLLRRTPDGSIYRKVAAELPADAQALIEKLEAA